MHLDDPYAFLVQEAGHVGDERVWILKIVKHGDGSDDAELLSVDRPRGKKIVHDAVGAGGRFGHQIFGRFKANAPDSFDVVGTKQGSVIAADVEDAIAAIQSGEARGFGGDVR
jgi:hypothetical protein